MDRAGRTPAMMQDGGGWWSMFPPELQVKQYVATVRGGFGSRWHVYRTGSDRHYLFSCVQNPTFCVPVLKTDLQDDVRKALANGWGHS